MEYFAHIRDDGCKQTVDDHLHGTAQKAKSFSIPLLKASAEFIGLIHDIGKYSITFQKRLDGQKVQYEHSSCGAIEVFLAAKGGSDESGPLLALMLPMLEYCIAGHHTGLPNGGNPSDINNPYDGTSLYHRLGRAGKYIGESNYQEYRNHVELKFPDVEEVARELISSNDKAETIEKYAFFTRYLFSCLTDADFLDTEEFCRPDIRRFLSSDFITAETNLENRLSGFEGKTELQKARGRIQKQAFANIDNIENIGILNMPTGSGKTLCSLKIALRMLNYDRKKYKRIIYVIPYTSIIEQTADIFGEVFGGDTYILQHHSNYDYEINDGTEEDEKYDTAGKLKRASENWDAPVIVTTSVQFFESLYHSKSSKLRKMHNISNSIIVFDEIHLLPPEVLQPCLRGIGYITKYLDSTALFLSATMPDYSKLFRKYLPGCKATELIKDHSDFLYFKKCKYINLGKTDYESVVLRALSCKNSLIVVNSRKAARDVYKLISGKKYHLSTYMTPADRSEVIRQIKKDLDKNEHITVVSTSLIEAGVDLDFETVFRELAGLDSILQAGGRCNREGKKELGHVFIFDTGKQTKDINNRSIITKSLLEKYTDITSDECIKEYFDAVFTFNEKITEQNSIVERESEKVKTNIDEIRFEDYAIKMIKDENIGIVINNCKETENIIFGIRNGNYSLKRSLQKYTVSLKMHEFNEALLDGIVKDSGLGFYELSNQRYYDKEIGLVLEYVDDIFI